jgi:ribosomal protein S18 acetylase RimI-like enzyme
MLTIRTMEVSDMDRVLELVAMHDSQLVETARVEIGGQLGSDQARFLVAEVGGKVVGVMGYHVDPWKVPDIFWAVWLFVDIARRRQGVATRLYSVIEQELVARGCRKIYLDVGTKANYQAAIAFHLSNGFELEGYLRDFWEDGEDFLIFGKHLRARSIDRHA